MKEHRAELYAKLSDYVALVCVWHGVCGYYMYVTGLDPSNKTSPLLPCRIIKWNRYTNGKMQIN